MEPTVFLEEPKKKTEKRRLFAVAAAVSFIHMVTWGSADVYSGSLLPMAQYLLLVCCQIYLALEVKGKKSLEILYKIYLCLSIVSFCLSLCLPETDGNQRAWYNLLAGPFLQICGLFSAYLQALTGENRMGMQLLETLLLFIFLLPVIVSFQKNEIWTEEKKESSDSIGGKENGVRMRSGAQVWMWRFFLLLLFFSMLCILFARGAGELQRSLAVQGLELRKAPADRLLLLQNVLAWIVLGAAIETMAVYMLQRAVSAPARWLWQGIGICFGLLLFSGSFAAGMLQAVRSDTIESVVEDGALCEVLLDREPRYYLAVSEELRKSFSYTEERMEAEFLKRYGIRAVQSGSEGERLVFTTEDERQIRFTAVNTYELENTYGQELFKKLLPQLAAAAETADTAFSVEEADGTVRLKLIFPETAVKEAAAQTARIVKALLQEPVYLREGEGQSFPLLVCPREYEETREFSIAFGNARDGLTEDKEAMDFYADADHIEASLLELLADIEKNHGAYLREQEELAKKQAEEELRLRKEEAHQEKPGEKGLYIEDEELLYDEEKALWYFYENVYKGQEGYDLLYWNFNARAQLIGTFQEGVADTGTPYTISAYLEGYDPYCFTVYQVFYNEENEVIRTDFLVQYLVDIEKGYVRKTNKKGWG